MFIGPAAHITALQRSAMCRAQRAMQPKSGRTKQFSDATPGTPPERKA